MKLKRAGFAVKDGLKETELQPGSRRVLPLPGRGWIECGRAATWKQFGRVAELQPGSGFCHGALSEN
jgi:hypothetical protein